MARRHYRPEEIISKLREDEALLAEGMTVEEVTKTISVVEQTYYRRCKELAGSNKSQIQAKLDAHC